MTTTDQQAIERWVRAHPDEAMLILRECAVRWADCEKHYAVVAGLEGVHAVRELRRLRGE